MATDEREREEFLKHLQELFEKVEVDAQTRHNEGASVYGPLKFLENDTLEMAYEEVLDMINYGRYTAVKVLLLQEQVAQMAAALEGSETTGARPSGFVPLHDSKEFKKA